jgi:hypothetical protein
MNSGLETYHFTADADAIKAIRDTRPLTYTDSEDKDALIRLLEATFSTSASTSNGSSKLPAPITFSQPPLCLEALHSALAIFMNTVMTGFDSEEEQVNQILTQYPDFVNSLVSWVFSMSSSEMFLSLETSLQLCSCDQTSNRLVERLHAGYQSISHPSLYGPLVEDLFSFLIKIVAAGLSWSCLGQLRWNWPRPCCG